MLNVDTSISGGSINHFFSNLSSQSTSASPAAGTSWNRKLSEAGP